MNVPVVGEQWSVIENPDDDRHPESCGGNVSFTNWHVLKAFYAGDLFSSWIIDSGTTNHVCLSL